MEYTYRFVTGESRTIPVTPEQHRMLQNEDRLEANNEQTHRTRTGRFVSLNLAMEEGMQFADPASLPLPAAEQVRWALAQLKPEQRQLLRAVYWEGVPVGEFARKQGVSQSAVSHRLQLLRRRMKEILFLPS